MCTLVGYVMQLALWVIDPVSFAVLKEFNNVYSKNQVNGRTVVIIISDGYDTGSPKIVSQELEKLKKRNCKIIWLNPLLGWENYEPVAASMKEASSYLDLFAPCSTIEDLENLEKELCMIWQIMMKN